MTRLLAGALVWIPIVAVAQSPRSRGLGPAPPMGTAAIARIEELARLRGEVVVGSVSSFDPSGGNDDGFSGSHSFLRREGDGLVIADLVGPGEVTRIWTPTPTDDPIEFFFDEEAVPRLRLPFGQLFTGERAPFLAPLSGSGAGGYFTYLSIPFRRHLKVVVRGERVQFFQINYARYPTGQGPTQATEVAASVADRAREILGRAGADLAVVVAGGAPVGRHRINTTAIGGQRVTLWASRTGGRVVGLRLYPASALAGSERAARLEFTWDGQPRPAVAAPAGDLFGYGWGVPATRALLVGTVADTNYLYFPMPYDRSARIDLVLDPGRPPIRLRGEVAMTAVPRRSDEGRFHAVWRRENSTTTGRPFTFLSTRGEGHVVGVALQAQGIGVDGTPFFEGDDRVVIDGDTVVRGTGSEDAFNGGWYDVPGRWDTRRSFPLSGSLGYWNALSRTGGYRLFLGDSYAFRREIELTIEHGTDTANAIPTDYASVTWFYSRGEPTDRGTELSPDNRAVRIPERISLSPGWVAPIHAFSLHAATLTKKSEQGIGRFLSLVADSGTTDYFGPHGVDLTAPVPVGGGYRISVQAVHGPGQGMVQLYQEERPVGSPLDTYAVDRRLGGLTALGTIELAAGDRPIRLKLVGRNPAATRLALDLVRVVLERVQGAGYRVQDGGTGR